MNYVEFTVSENTYKLRLSTKYTIALEKALGHNPIQILFDLDNGNIPTITEIVTILHYCLQQYNHGLKIDDSYDIYDEYLAEGNTMFTFINDVIVPVYKESGLLAKESDKEEDEAKN